MTRIVQQQKKKRRMTKHIDVRKSLSRSGARLFCLPSAAVDAANTIQQQQQQKKIPVPVHTLNRDVYLTKHKLKEARNKAMSLVRLLLWNKIRDTLNEERQQRAVKRYKAAIQQYLQQCKQQAELPVYTDMACIECNLLAVEEWLDNQTDKREQVARIQKYTDIIMDMWQNVVHFSDFVNDPKTDEPQSIDFESVALFTLFQMRQGFCIGQLQILPKDSYLNQRLPIINDISRFGKDRKKITRGDKMVRNAYQRAAHKGVPLESMALRRRAKQFKVGDKTEPGYKHQEDMIALGRDRKTTLLHAE